MNELRDKRVEIGKNENTGQNDTKIRRNGSMEAIKDKLTEK